MEQTTAALTAAALQAQMVAFVRAFGLHRPDSTPCGQPVGVADAYTLMELARTDGLSQNELAARLRLEKSTVSRLVGQLEQRGWVARTRDAHDGRVRVLQLTAAGRTVATDLAAARQAKFARVFAALPDDQRAGVLDALAVLVEAMDADH